MFVIASKELLPNVRRDLFILAGIFLGTSQLAYRWQKLGQSPSPARKSGGMLPREIFEKSDAIICIFVYFEGHKIATWWLYFDVGGVCIELESDLFLSDMAAEGRGNTILTRALQLVPGPSKLLGDLKPTLFPFEKRAQKCFFSTSRLSPFPFWCALCSPPLYLPRTKLGRHRG